MGDLTRNAVEVLPEGRLAEQLAGGRPLRVKLGIDPTTADIHLGHTVVLEKLREFQDAGHTVVLIIGDFTARVGDPSGRSSTRPLPSPEEIEANAATYQEQAFKLLDRERTEVRFNSEWLRMEPEALLGLLAQTTVARLLERDDFQKRLAAGQAIAALELLYPLLQGYDSVAVAADVELGGTDQKFNLLFGRDVQTAYGQKPQSILTMPILVGTDGVRKMSKSLDNYVGVTDAPEEMFGRLMSIPDEAMDDYYRLLLGAEQPASGPNEAKRELARRIVDRFHGEGSGATAEEHFNRVIRDGGVPEEIARWDIDPAAAGELRMILLPKLIGSGFELSSSEARRLIKQGGVKLDGETIAPDILELPREALDGRVLQVGKRRFLSLYDSAA
ncbi:MAG TPA: tyrosine--tRNA ligase [Solirubrobacterales bacterium]|jgi:tyrosyl-tRNA synthetase|nr:tyrosine--tRNA ligase [Solirubrobacterales bacterium]